MRQDNCLATKPGDKASGFLGPLGHFAPLAFKKITNNEIDLNVERMSRIEKKLALLFNVLGVLSNRG